MAHGAVSTLAMGAGLHTGGVTDWKLPSTKAVEEDRWRQAQRAWAMTSVGDRIAVLRRARQKMALQTKDFVAAIAHPARLAGETMVAEVLPLLEACRFLERDAEKILTVRRLGRRGLPFWLSGIDSEVRRTALGKVLVIGPANYPLFVPGVQVLQALAAGNAVVWKPGSGGRNVAEIFAAAMFSAGLPHSLLRIADDTVDASWKELAIGADKVFFTGSADAGKAVLAQLAVSATPSVMELSGCDAVIVLPSADLDRVAAALTFGLRFNGSATCMAPRRVFVVEADGERRRQLFERLAASCRQVPGVALAPATQKKLIRLLELAVRGGARVHGGVSPEQQPVLMTGVAADMEIANADLFAPVLLLMQEDEETEVLRALDQCSFALTVSIFGHERQARPLAQKITAGTVMVNDLIIPSADPRVPFGGRKNSGFGVTRGREGLMEMTAVQVVAARRSVDRRQYAPVMREHEKFFEALVCSTHAAGWKRRLSGVRRLVASGRKLRKP